MGSLTHSDNLPLIPHSAYGEDPCFQRGMSPTCSGGLLPCPKATGICHWTTRSLEAWRRAFPEAPSSRFVELRVLEPDMVGRRYARGNALQRYLIHNSQMARQIQGFSGTVREQLGTIVERESRP